MIDNYKIGNRITLLRKEKELTGEKFAEMLGVSPQAVSKWENGKNLPETALLPKLSELLGVSVDSILMPQQEVKKIEKKYRSNDTELHRYDVVRSYVQSIPQIFEFDRENKTIVMEDLSDKYIAGHHFNEVTKQGLFVRESYHAILRTAAKWHGAFWENSDAFGRIGLDWRFETKENLAAHISMMEKDFKKYRKNEEAGKIPKAWEGEFAGTPFRFENHITSKQLDCFADAISRLKNDYWALVEARFHTGKNITVIHGDMHPGTANVSKSPDRTDGTDRIVKFDGLQAVRMGLPTEDLAMLVALHIEPDKKQALPLLDYYYRCLCESVQDYPYETFIGDYRTAVMENMFFAIRHINRGIYDFKMRDNAIRAFESFVLER